MSEDEIKPSRKKNKARVLEYGILGATVIFLCVPAVFAAGGKVDKFLDLIPMILGQEVPRDLTDFEKESEDLGLKPGGVVLAFEGPMVVSLEVVASLGGTGVTVHWGDGSSDRVEPGSKESLRKYVQVSGEFDVVLEGAVHSFKDRAKTIILVRSFGDTVSSLRGAFGEGGTYGLEAVASLPPTVINLDNSFSGFMGRTPKGLEDWDVRNVASMQGMFRRSDIEADLSKWCVPQFSRAPVEFGIKGRHEPNWGICPGLEDEPDETIDAEDERAEP